MHPHDIHRNMRCLNLEGATNFRDIGGYPAHGGGSVRWRRIFRSNHLGHLSANDLETLKTLGLRSVIDFRSEDEAVRSAPCRIDGPGRHSMPMDPTIVRRLEALRAAGEQVDGPVTERLMCELYRGFVRDYRHHFRGLFEHLLADSVPLVFHCSAGKDRTGFAAAMVLSALGVSRALVFEDYLLTNQHWRMDAATAMGFPDGVAAVLGRADTAFLAAAFDTIDSEFGGMDAYLHNQLGLDATRRGRLLANHLDF